RGNPKPPSPPSPNTTAKQSYPKKTKPPQKNRRVCQQSEAGYAGPFTLIYDSPFFPDEWDGILLQKQFIEDFLREAPAVRTA
ncbi:hypothetical protein ACCC98_00005, partial [Rhizobium pisi]